MASAVSGVRIVGRPGRRFCDGMAVTMMAALRCRGNASPGIDVSASQQFPSCHPAEHFAPPRACGPNATRNVGMPCLRNSLIFPHCPLRARGCTPAHRDALICLHRPSSKFHHHFPSFSIPCPPKSFAPSHTHALSVTLTAGGCLPALPEIPIFSDIANRAMPAPRGESRAGARASRYAGREW
jgi:hypothetical protein